MTNLRADNRPAPPEPPTVSAGRGKPGQRLFARLGSSGRRIVPRPKRLTTALVLVFIVTVLGVEAYANARFVPDGTHEGKDQGTVPAAVLRGGPIINTAAGRTESYRLPPKTIALTFDDGPDPKWTPEVLRVLRENNVKATFFVVGAQMVRHPDVARQLTANGHQLGIHTFTHPDLTKLPGWRRQLEYAQTELAIARTAGVRTTLVRSPYSSKASAIDDPNWPVVREAGALGYLTVLNDLDSEDWKRPGADAIRRSATPTGDSGAITLWHDAGGERSQTLAALRQFIPEMKARGYRFTTVTEGLNLTLGTTAGRAQQVSADTPASATDRWRGTALLWSIRIADHGLAALAVLFVIVGTLTIARTVLMFLLAGRLARRRRLRDFAWGPPVNDPVSVIVPAYNEKEGIEAAVRSLASGDHPGIEVIVVDDGSTDNTAEIAEGLGLPNVRVFRQPNSGKSTALNTGVALASHELIVMVDGDTIFEPSALHNLVQPFGDLRVGAVAGNVKVGNRDSLVAKWQHIEYVIGFSLDRRLYETLQCMPTIPGAIGAFRRVALLGAGGMSDDTLAEDTDITMAISRAGWHVVYEENARAWTEAPATFDQLWKQRYRWSYGTMQAMWKHRRAIVDSGPSGRFGRRGLPFLAFFGVLLPLLAPVIDVLAIYGLIFANRMETVVGWSAMLGLQLITALVAFRLDREKLGPLWALPLQQFAYRQLMYLVLLQSTITALTGVRLRWHKLDRIGLVAAIPVRPSPMPVEVPVAVPIVGNPATRAVDSASATASATVAVVGGAVVGKAADEAVPAGPAASGRQRNRYFAVLNAAALVCVVSYHLLGGALPSLVLPAIGVMFAVAGSVLAGSLSRAAASNVVLARIRRLLPALWALAVVVVPLMLWHDWAGRPGWSGLLLWVLPVAEAPATPAVARVTGVLGYLAAYVWLVLLTPLALWAYRRWPIRTVLTPLVGVFVMHATPGLLNSSAGDVATDVATLGACWMVGFAHRDGALRRLAWPLVAGLAAACVTAGAAWAVSHPGGSDGDAIAIAPALCSLGLVLVLLRVAPNLDWLSRVRPLDALVTSLNARAVTVYLWHTPAIAVAFLLGEAIGAAMLGSRPSAAGQLVLALAVLVGLVLLLGWVEDLGGGRAPRLLPWRSPGFRRTPPPTATAQPAPAERAI